MLHSALGRALATAHIEDLLRDAAQRHTIRLARRVAQEPHLAAASDVPMFSGGNVDRPSATAVLATTDFER
jgi:hypothetical protein